MKKRNTTVSNVMKMDSILSLSQADRVNLFVDKGTAHAAIYLELGKLFRVIEANLTRRDKGIFPLLEKAGVKKGTISNANYAAKVFDLVDAGQITEADFDTLSFSECFAIARVTSSRSKKRLTTEDVAAAIKSRADFAEDFNHICEFGVTVAERAQAESDAAATKAQQQKEAEEKAAADAAELASAKAEAEDLKGQLAQAQATAEPAPEPTDPADEEAEALTPEIEALLDAKEAAEDVEELEAQLAEAKAKTTNPAVVTAADVLPLLDEVELAFTEMSPEDQSIVAARLIEMADRVCTAGITPHPAGLKNPPATKKNGKGKKALAAA